MAPPTVWLNKSFSSTCTVVETIRTAEPGAFRLLRTHTNPHVPALRIADAAEAEPKNLSEADYLAYCLEVVRRHRVAVFVPGKNLRSIAAARGRFEALGCRVVAAAAPETIELLEDKARLYASLEPGLVAVPAHRVVNDLPGFDAAYAELKARHGTVCFKPCVSVFGLGFRVVTEWGRGIDRLLGGDPIKIGLADARYFLAQRSRFRDLMVMQYLPGPERSVDCLAHEGELVRAVVRLKSGALEGGQLLEDNPALVKVVRKLTARLRLNAVFNIQFRDVAGVPHLLEINPRMSGGLHYACLSGVAFPYWALRLALGTATPDDVPRPQTGGRVSQVNRAFPL